LIPAVSRGGRMRGLLRYLVGRGHDGEHRDPHFVAGVGMEAWRGVKLDEWAADRIAEQLDAPRLRSHARVTVPRKREDGNVLVDVRGRPERADAHVWHCSLSLHPEEPALGDEQWSQLAREFVAEMGFVGQRWVAIRHGETKNGGDHVHLVVQLVTDDGKAAGVHNDRPRAQEACRKLEREHGLRLVEGRDRKRGARATDYRQRYRAEREHEQAVTAGKPEPGSPEPDREMLERAVRRLAAASAGEAEFVRRLRAEGMIVRPRFAAGREDLVVGYSVALTPAEGREVVPHAGGTLAKDLTLPRLRGANGWTAHDPGAIDEWRRAFEGREPGVGSESNPWLALPSWEDALAELRALRDAAGRLPAGEQASSAQAAGLTSALMYGWAELAGEHAPVLRDLAGELSLSAEIRAGAAKAARPVAPARSMAVLCAALVRPSNQTLFWLALAQELQALAVAVQDMHQAAGEAQRAAALATAVREQLAPLTVRLEDEHAAVDRDYGEARDALRLARAGQARPIGDALRQAPQSPPARPAPSSRREEPRRGPRPGG
jgi:hypothetical protein